MGKAVRVSRRSSLRVLGAMGATAVFGGAADVTPPSLESETEKKESNVQAGDAVAIAVARFGKGHLCAQAVFSSFAEQLGMKYETAAKLSTGFGTGMGMGSVCGAVSGAIMAIGLKHGGIDPKTRGQTRKLVQEFVDRFKAQHQFLNCRELLGCDPNTPEGRQLAKEKKLYSTVCNGIVTDAAQILKELLAQDRQETAG
jgi:C_GCAxxG_C_C family probable redox protein